MGQHESKLRWYQFRLVSLLAATAVLALVLGALVSSLPERVSQEFEPVADDCLLFSWKAKAAPRPDGDGHCDFSIMTRWYAERPFRMRFCGRSDRAASGGVFMRDVSALMRSRRQLVGHNAVVECEFSLSGSVFTIVETTGGSRRVVCRGEVSDPQDLRWTGRPPSEWPHRRWQKVGSCGNGAVALGWTSTESSAGRFVCEFEFLDEQQ
jgi:hypothetical protein